MSYLTGWRNIGSLAAVLLLAAASGCGQEKTARSELRTAAAVLPVPPPADEILPAARLNDGPPPIQDWVTADGLPQQIALFQHVFWEPDDTLSLRTLIRDTDLVRDRRILEIGTGSGLVSLCCLQAGAAQVVATDINSFAMKNAAFNAELLGFTQRFEVRLVPQRDPGAWSVIHDGERFDLVISNPPWENDRPTNVADFALYDPDFQLMTSLLDGLPERLNPGGRALLAYGCVSAIRTLQELAAERKLVVRVLDERRLEDLDEIFLPGMLLEVSLPR